MVTYILGTLICLLTMGIFIYIRTEKSPIYGLIAKVVASFSFIMLAVFLTRENTNLNIPNSLASACIIMGLVSGLIGDIFLDLKRCYPFQESIFLRAGITSFGIGHLLYICSIFLFAHNHVSLITRYLPVFLILVGAVAIAVIFYFVSKKVMKLKYGNHSFFIGAYSFILIFTFLLSVYTSIVLTHTAMFVLAIALGLFLLSDVILSLQYFGSKEESRKLTIANHVLYYVAQILIAGFIFFI